MSEEQKFASHKFLLQIGRHLVKEMRKERLNTDYKKFKYNLRKTDS